MEVSPTLCEPQIQQKGRRIPYPQSFSPYRLQLSAAATITTEWEPEHKKTEKSRKKGGIPH